MRIFLAGKSRGALVGLFSFSGHFVNFGSYVCHLNLDGTAQLVIDSKAVVCWLKFRHDKMMFVRMISGIGEGRTTRDFRLRSPSF